MFLDFIFVISRNSYCAVKQLNLGLHEISNWSTDSGKYEGELTFVFFFFFFLASHKKTLTFCYCRTQDHYALHWRVRVPPGWAGLMPPLAATLAVSVPGCQHSCLPPVMRLFCLQAENSSHLQGQVSGSASRHSCIWVLFVTLMSWLLTISSPNALNVLVTTSSHIAATDWFMGSCLADHSADAFCVLLKHLEWLMWF